MSKYENNIDKITGINLRTFLIVLTSALMIRSSVIMIINHFKCRGGLYPRSNIERFPVPDDKVSWSSEYKEYQPPNHTASSIHGMPWADLNIGDPNFKPQWNSVDGKVSRISYRGQYNIENGYPLNPIGRTGDPNFKPQWNSVDGKVSRISYMGQYNIENGYPLNPIGRTGICGRGVLGRWGPNHAADPVVTRWKRLENGEIEKDFSNKPILQCVAVKRRDTGEWALPGGMVDPGEKVSATAVREFQEEAMNSLELDENQKKAWFQRFEKFFNMGDVVYKGYIDDHRNTDNAWMESVAYNFHDNNGSTVGALKLHAGDDAVGVRWVDVTADIQLYASHKDIVMAVFDKCLSNFPQSN